MVTARTVPRDRFVDLLKCFEVNMPTTYQTPLVLEFNLIAHNAGEPYSSQIRVILEEQVTDIFDATYFYCCNRMLLYALSLMVVDR